MPTTVIEADTPEDYAAFGRLITLYEEWLRTRYESVPDLIATIRAHQNLDAELAALPEKYGPPEGVVLLAAHDDDIAGGVAYRDLGDGSCEMKRMYVLQGFQGLGIGRRLCQALIEHATAAGYQAMRLDTGFLNSEAMAMYARMGFAERDAYAYYPPEIAVHLRFMERPLP
jgi:GNAT superfamily N-acetyltransferase